MGVAFPAWCGGAAESPVLPLHPDNANLGITLVALGILGVCLAFIYVQLNPEFHEAVRLPQPAAAGGGGGDDLDDDLDDELD